MSRSNNRKGQIFIVSVIIAVTAALIASATLLHFLFKETNPDQFLGKYQSAIIDSMNDGDRVLLYIDEASKMSVASALDEYLYGNPNPLTNVEGGDVESKYCGSYVYRLWNTLNENCYPDYKSKDFELSKLISKHLSELTISGQINNNPSKEEQYFNNILTQEINYKYSYLQTTSGTTIAATTENQYTINIFKDKQTALDSNIQSYLRSRSAYSGSLIWPLANDFDVSSCFGYRGNIDTLSGVKASVGHPGLDINVAANTPVLAAAHGTIEQILYPAWGKIIINHGNGLKTSYIHMNAIAEGLVVGSVVEQGQVIGYVGGRGAYSANDYAAHLHFEVISTTVDPNTKYEGVSAVIKNMYVNPVCFIDATNPDGTSQTITFNPDSLACNSICNVDGTGCACSETQSTFKCTKPDVDAAKSAPYKFCSMYEGVVSKEAACLKSANTNWKIEKIELSGQETSAELTSDQTLKISMTIENKGDSCVNLKPEINIIAAGETISTELVAESVNAYSSTDKAPFTVSEIATCTFTTDENIFRKARDEKKCVLYAPIDGSTKKYTVTAKITDYNGEVKTYEKTFTNNELTFTIKKGKTNSYTGNALNSDNIQSNIAQLSDSEKAKIDKTRANLEAQNAIAYIEETSIKYEIPKEILLGKITQESTGVNTKINLPKNRAIGISQVEGWQHYDTIQSVCGKDYVSECNKCGTTANTFKDCCKFEKFGDDIECQINVGAEILKGFYDTYNSNDNAYSKAVLATCHNPIYQQKYLSYTGWERALRAYNGFGCEDLNAPYVDMVMKYASGWGYIDTNSKLIKEEMYAGILGKYYINPDFDVKINFDMNLMDILKNFANNTVNACGKEGIDKDKCIQKSIEAFNDSLPQAYKNLGIYLDTSCDSTKNMEEVSRFVEEVNNCMQSPDDKCQCVFTNSNVNVKSINSVDGSTQITYYTEDNNAEMANAYFDYSILKENNYFSVKSSRLGSINLYKNKTQLLVNVPLAQPCNSNIVKSTYRFCLETNYKYNVYDDNTKEIKNKYIQIPFAITVRDNVAPKPIEGLEYTPLNHSKNSIILQWTAGSEGDIVGYKIYLVDDESQFKNRQTVTFKNDISYKYINSKQTEFIEYKKIDFSSPISPICMPKESEVEGTKYCTFEYKVTDKDDVEKTIQLEEEKLYYISSQKKFMYILNGSNTLNRLSEGKDKFIAVTGIDIDGNEINNVENGQGIELEKNLISAVPKDLLEAGLSEIIHAELRDQSTSSLPSLKLILSWNAINNYIDNTPVSNEKIKYKVYLGEGNCKDGELKAINTGDQSFGPYNAAQETAIDISGANPDGYCVGVSAITEKDLEYKEILVKYLSTPSNTRPITPP